MTTGPRVPTTILSGFLGSGKTTRLNALLRHPLGRRIAVVMNEIGEIGIEAARVQGATEFIELEGGCLCCQLRDDLEVLLGRLADRGGFDHLVIETTGLADPLGVAWTLERPNLRERFRVDAIVVVVDALAGPDLIATHPEAALQIERADVAIVSKLDLAGEHLDTLTAAIHEANPSARIVPAGPTETPWDLLLDLVAPPREPGANAHVPHATATGWETWRFATGRTVDEDALTRFLLHLPENVYRTKGLVRLADGWVIVNAVGGRFELEPCTPQTMPDESVLVCIGREIDRAGLSAQVATLTV